MATKIIKHPCQGCIYFPVCGKSGRTEPCAGRVTKTEKKKQEEAAKAGGRKNG